MFVPILSLVACGPLGDDAVRHLDDLPRLEAVEEQRLGHFDDPDLGFTFPVEADVDRDGNLYVLEASVPEIRVFDPDGAPLRRIGQRGDGPGEFRTPIFGVLGDTVWAVDPEVNRITLFDREGRLLSTGSVEQVRFALPESYGYVWPVVLRPDGRFMSAAVRVGWHRDDEPTGVDPSDSIPVPLVLFDPSGAVVDTAGWAPRPPPRLWRPPAEDDMKLETVNVDGRRFIVPMPPTRMAEWHTLADAYITVEAPPAQDGEGVVVISRIAPAGDTVYRRELRYSPVPYPGADLDSIAARAARGAAGGMVPIAVGGGGPPPPDDPAAVARRLRQAMDFPEFQHPLERSWLAQDGAVWMRRPAGEAAAQWVLLQDDGRPRGVLDLPATARVVWSRGDAMWAVVADEYDVPWLVRYRLRPA